jgi:hypothetical protein
MNLRQQPLFVRSSLTMDYVNHSRKMREIEEYFQKTKPISYIGLAARWVLFGILLTAILLVIAYGGKA